MESKSYRRAVRDGNARNSLVEMIEPTRNFKTDFAHHDVVHDDVVYPDVIRFDVDVFRLEDFFSSRRKTRNWRPRPLDRKCRPRRRRFSTSTAVLNTKAAPDFNGGAGFQQRRRISTAALDFDSDAEPHPDDDAGHRRRGCVDRRIDAVLRRKRRHDGVDLLASYLAHFSTLMNSDNFRIAAQFRITFCVRVFASACMRDCGLACPHFCILHASCVHPVCVHPSSGKIEIRKRES